MTKTPSGVFKKPIKEIKVPPDRQRQDLDEKALDKLALSLSTTGLIQPIVVDEHNRLIAGERRLRAAQLNGWTEIECKLVSGLDELEKQIMEFEENLRRKQLSPAEEVLAQKRLHELYEEKYGKFEREDIMQGRVESSGWRQRNTAELLGITEGLLSVNLKIAEALESTPELAKLKTRDAMLKAVEHQEEQSVRKLVALLETTNQRVPVESSSRARRVFQHGEIKLVEGDSCEVLQELEPESVSLLLTDPLWDVGFDEEITSEHAQGVQDVLQEVLVRAHELMKPGAYGAMFYAMKRHCEYKQLLEVAGFVLSPVPLIWYKPGQGFVRDMFMRPRPDYEPCFLFFKPPQAKLTKPLGCVHECKTGSDGHKAEKPTEMLSAIIASTTVEDELVLDPFCGGGSTLEAALLMGRRALGIDIDPESFELSVERLKRRPV